MKTELKQWIFHTEEGDFDCTAPASMYGVLLENGKIEDPYYRLNEKKCTPLSLRDCVMETTFRADETVFAHRHRTLRFEGIDTLADVFLNGRRLGHAENMHRTYEFDVTDRLREGENTLRVEFASPMKYMAKEQAAHYVKGDGNSMEGIAHIRKASCMMGWDWGPTLPDMGLWRPVYLCAYDCRIGDLEIRQIHREGEVSLCLRLTPEGEAAGVTARVTVTDPEGNVIATPAFDEDFECSVTIKEPRLWWPNGYGEQPLYGVRAELLADGAAVDATEKKIGLRTVTVSTAKDAWGKEFCFVVNGVKIFAMGADYIPEDNILSRRSPERTEKLIRQSVAANFNSLRVWGGGVYPDDWFYDLCDRYGLLVWQDFMFACINVWMVKDFEENIKAEFVDNLRRIRHHASLGLLCGNNEMELVLVTSSYGASQAVRQDYLYLYERLLPGICREEAPDVYYWPSSPSSGGGFDNPGADEKGDSHYWSCWHGGKPLTEYRKHYFRFCSEFGFEALPDRKTVEEFTLPSDRNLFSPVMMNHQKCNVGNGRIMSYLADYYLYPTTFDAVLYGSQQIQADSIKMAVEHMRRNRGRCMGAVYWQLNDIWPVASWSSIDGKGRRKALHYAAAKFFAPVLLSACEDGTHVTFNVSNETRAAFRGTATVRVITREFEVLDELKFDVNVAPLSAADLLTRDFTAADGKETECFLSYTLADEKGKTVSGGVTLFVRPKFFVFRHPQIRAGITGEGTRKTLHLTADTFVHKLRVDFEGAEPELPDNYVDIVSPEDVTLSFDSDLPARELEEKIRFFSLYDMAPECYE